MTLEEFHKSLNSEHPPEDLTPSLAALWWDAKGDWTKAHEFAQRDEGPAGAWVHAYLHRKEGDLSNAGYWYGRAGCGFRYGSPARKLTRNAPTCGGNLLSNNRQSEHNGVDLILRPLHLRLNGD